MKFCDIALGARNLGVNMLLLVIQSFGALSPTQGRVVTKRVVFRCGKGLIVRSKEGPAEPPRYFQPHLADGDWGIPGDNRGIWNRKQILSAILFILLTLVHM